MCKNLQGCIKLKKQTELRKRFEYMAGSQDLISTFDFRGDSTSAFSFHYEHYTYMFCCTESQCKHNCKKLYETLLEYSEILTGVTIFEGFLQLLISDMI